MPRRLTDLTAYRSVQGLLPSSKRCFRRARRSPSLQRSGRAETGAIPTWQAPIHYITPIGRGLQRPGYSLCLHSEAFNAAASRMEGEITLFALRAEQASLEGRLILPCPRRGLGLPLEGCGRPGIEEVSK